MTDAEARRLRDALAVLDKLMREAADRGKSLPAARDDDAVR